MNLPADKKILMITKSDCYLQEYLPRQIGVCHCTGVDKYAFFYKDFGDSTFYNYTGKLIQTDLSE